MKRDGHTVLLTTHYLDEAEALCDRIAIIDRGRIVASGHAARADRRGRRRYRRVVAHDARRSRAAGSRRSPGITGSTCDGPTATFRTRDVNRTVAALLTRARRAPASTIVELHVQKASLEDVFLELTASAPT